MEPYQTTIFKFLAVRTPKSGQGSETGNGLIRYPQDVFSTIETSLFRLLSNQMEVKGASLGQLQEIVQDFSATGDWFKNKKSVWNAAPGLQDFFSWLLTNQNLTDVAGISIKMVEFTGFSPIDVVNQPGSIEFESRLWDNLIGEAILPSRSEIGDALCPMIRLHSMLRKIVNEPSNLDSPGGINKAITAHILLPSPLFPLTFESNLPPVTNEPSFDGDPEVLEALEEIKQVKKVMEEMHQVFSFTAEEVRYQPPAPLEEVETTANKTGVTETSEADLRVFTAAMVGATSLETQTYLQSQGFSQMGFDLSFAVNRLEKKLKHLGTVAYKADQVHNTTVIVGGLELQSGIRGLKNDADIHTWAKVPQSVGMVKPIGVGDLKVVEQELLCYEAGEIAHVENILAGESKERFTRRLNRTEETLIEEQENIREEERDSQTTERFALQKESSQVVQNEMQVQAGVSVTATYGPVFVTADAGFAAGTSTQTAESSAEDYAKEVTERARTRVVDRVRREKITTIIREFEETNRHAVENADNPDHIVGVYRWLDKT